MRGDVLCGLEKRHDRFAQKSLCRGHSQNRKHVSCVYLKEKVDKARQKESSGSQFTFAFDVTVLAVRMIVIFAMIAVGRVVE